MLKKTKNAKWQFRLEITPIKDAFETSVEIKLAKWVFAFNATYDKAKKIVVQVGMGNG